MDGFQSSGCYCRKWRWYEFVSFFALNYGAHAFSVITPPGVSLRRSVMWVICCIGFPYAGLGAPAVLLASLHCWPWKEESLQKALRAGALCMVVRTDGWSPLGNGTTIPASQLKATLSNPVLHPRSIQSNPVGQPPNAPETVSQIRPGTYQLLVVDTTLVPTKLDLYEKILAKLIGLLFSLMLWLIKKMHLEGLLLSLELGLKETTVQGQSLLPKGFKFATVPPNAKVHRNYPSVSDPKLSHLPQTVKSLASLGQLCIAIFTLLRVSSGCGQLKRYGFVSPALTVIPYAIMSLVNAIANITTPYYPAQFLVWSSILDEAKLYGGEFDSVVGRLEELQNSGHTSSMILVNSHRNGLIKVLKDTSDQSPGIMCRNGEAPEGGRHERLEDTGQEQAREINRARERNDIHESYQRAPDNNESEIFRGQLHLAFNPNPETNRDRGGRLAAYIFCILLIVHYIIIWGLTHFDKGGSTQTQRFAIMMWILIGQVLGTTSVGVYLNQVELGKLGTENLYLLVIFAIPPIWAFIIVGKMLQELGECIQLS